MSSQFKFKPDKIKYLSTIDTLDSSHKKIINGINKKRDDMPKKEKRLLKLKNELELLDSNNSEIHNYISIRTKLIDEINNLTEEIDKIENYEDELDYYEKTHEILFNYYDIIDGHKIVSNNINNNSINNINQNNSDLHNFNQFEISDINTTFKTSSNLQNSDIQSDINTDIKTDTKYELYSDIKIDSKQNILSNNNLNVNADVKNNDWEIDGIEIFKKTNALDKLDILNQMSKMKRKEKKTTRKRVKNVESLVRDSNNIFDYLEGKNNSDNNDTNSKKSSSLIDNNNSNAKNNDTNNSQIINNTYNLNINNNIIINNSNDNNFDKNKSNSKYDRASLFEDYKILLEGYPTQKKTNKPCINCGPLVNKVLIYSEGIYVCLTCGEVEKCIIENDITNYKDPMVEKPTFPYKRKNHFCEWIKFIGAVKYNYQLISCIKTTLIMS